MTFKAYARGKVYAVRTLWRMAVHLRNWAPVWQAYRSGCPTPVLQFRRGCVLTSTRWDAPVLMLHEIYAEKIYRRCLRSVPEGVVLDIGANIGAVAVDFATQWARLTIHAYEPNPATFESLRQNIEANGLQKRVVSFNEAVAGKVGHFDLWTGVVSVGSGGYMDSPPPCARTVRVASVDLETVFRRVGNQPIYLLKVDVEGAELDIFENARELSFANVQNVAIECHEKLRRGATNVCRSVLGKHGFKQRMYIVSEDAGIAMLYGWRG